MARSQTSRLSYSVGTKYTRIFTLERLVGKLEVTCRFVRQPTALLCARYKVLNETSTLVLPHTPQSRPRPKRNHSAFEGQKGSESRVNHGWRLAVEVQLKGGSGGPAAQCRRDDWRVVPDEPVGLGGMRLGRKGPGPATEIVSEGRSSGNSTGSSARPVLEDNPRHHLRIFHC